MNKTIKIMSTIMMVIVLCFTCTAVFAGGSTGSSGSSGPTIPNVTPPSDDRISTLGGNIAGIVQAVGISIAVVILVYIGIRYIIGSAEEQAQYKKTMIPYLIGAVLLFIASFLVGVIADFAQNSIAA